MGAGRLGVAILRADRKAALSRATFRRKRQSRSPAGKPAGRPCRQPRTRRPAWPRIRPIDALRPFIFQLPAISGRMALVMSEFPSRYWGSPCASRARAAVPDAGSASPRRPLTASIGPPRKVATRRPSLYDGFINSVTPVCGIRLQFSLGRDPVPSCQTSWTHASRNAQSLIKLARQNHHGHGDGRPDRQLRHLGHRRHLQGFWTVDAGQGRPYRDLDRTVPPDLHRAAAADRPPVRPSVDHGSGARLRPRPPGAAANHCGSSARRRGSAAWARTVQ